MAKRCVILDDYQQVALKLGDWDRLAGEIEPVAIDHHVEDEDALAELLKDASVLCVMRERTPIPASLIARLPKLELIITAGRGVNVAVDFAFAKTRGILSCSTTTPDRPADAAYNATAELAFGLILSLVRNIPAEDRNIRAGGWQTSIGELLYGKTLGIIGLGNLGKTMCRYGLAFGMRPLAWSNSLTSERAQSAGAEYATKEALLHQSDIVTIHLVLGDRSRGLIGRDEIALMKPTAYLINTARGPIVDEAALIEALEAHRIAGAALDAHDIEPLPAGHPFRSLDNVVVTPHLGYVVENTYRGFFTNMVAVIRAWLDGAPINVVT